MVRLKPYRSLNSPKCLTGLNSTMVRLKLDGVYTNNGTLYKRLNSTMVRLKRVITFGIFDTLEESQFHYGSIKTIIVSFYFFFSARCLNSTMVRLKRVNGFDVYDNYDFKSQFHYGSIKTFDSCGDRNV